MAKGTASALPAEEQAARVSLQVMLRFAVGTTAAFIICEVMGWYPSFLAPLFTGMLLANLPVALPAKAGVALVLVEAIGAYAAYLLTSSMTGTPIVIFGAVSLVIFVCFAGLARGKSFLPLLLTLISFATVPVMTLVAPQAAGGLPLAYTRAMTIAVVAVWAMHAIWPATADFTPPAPTIPFASPIAKAIGGCAIVLPLMLIYLMYGITDALPVLITTIVLVTNFDPRRGATQGVAMMFGNFVGGMIAVVALAVVQTAPSLANLCLIAFLIGAVFAGRIERGGPGGAVALVTYNQAMVMFSLALLPGGADTGLWATRLFQFGIASFFAVGMMTHVLPLAHKASTAVARP